ncbi:sigma-70 family RNA polymerase sigma factor [Paracidobacterium acidisoli]|uniref:Sigma-70 family RNA polymerase sigma factor n=1 Tax=Paracidobacterium acidisoli TaxID=2303751 RepID=A0A372IS87_9BACT|nr:sigma-70 family RNA polymerase sigma factor [Paracidobacterium acidisoli]MBT9330736.1 sigma-70 family RNA polymerase sigma factor [Paracidobacterium acidisoli]
MSKDSENPAGSLSRSSDRAPRATEQQDSVLLSLIQAGDQSAMSVLFDRYASLVYSVALRVLRTPAEAEDVMQEILIQLWKSPGAFVAGRGSLGAWLAVVARNRAIDTLRRRRTADPIELFDLPATGDLARTAERNVLMEKVRIAIQTLPGEQQKSLEMAFFEGLSHTEIAEKTGEPLGTVKTRIRLGLLSIRKALQS